MKKNFLILLSLYLLFKAGDWIFWQGDLDEAIDQEGRLVIEKNWSATRIAQELVQADLFPNQRSFLKNAEHQGWLESLKPGVYPYSSTQTRYDILKALHQGAHQEKFLIPEGWTAQDIDEALAQKGYIHQGEFLQCLKACLLQKWETETPKIQPESLEGFLAPNTYFIDSESFEISNFTQMLLNEHQKWRQELKIRDEEADRLVIVASLVEKEALLDKDFPMIAGIIFKRLEADWTLGIDATLLYVDEDGRLTREDLQKDHPYNTRIRKGLPPSAIANPGKKSLEAAKNPKSSPYWFYINRQDTGEAVYAVDYESHNQNIDQYLR